MDQKNIMLTIARYLVFNDKTLKGRLVKPGYFNIGGKLISESGHDGFETFYGHVVDIVAQAIENGKFFGWYISDKPDQATNSGNSRLVPLHPSRKGTEILVKDFEETDQGLLVKFPLVSPREYLSKLKTREGFRGYAEVVDLTSKTRQGPQNDLAVCHAIDNLFDS